MGLEDTLNTISETPEKTLQNIKENNQIIDDNLIHRQPSTSLCTSWSPLASTKLLRSTGKNDKLSSELFHLNIIKILILLVSKVYLYVQPNLKKRITAKHQSVRSLQF